MVRASGSMQDDIFERVLTMAYEAMEAREPGQWILTRDALSAGFPQSALSDQTAFQLKLVNALPIPDRSVPFEDVLMFRERRSAELQALRHHIEGIAIEVGKTGWGSLAETVAWEQFEAAITDHAKVSRETNFAKRLTSLEVKFNWSDLAKPGAWGGLLGAASGVMHGLPLLAAAFPALAGLGSCVSIESTMGLKRKKSAQPDPFEYIFYAHKEL